MAFLDDRRDPSHWDLLCEDDKEVYRRLSWALSAPTTRDKRNRRVEDFGEIVDAIEVFINVDNVDQWKRCLVCGFCTFGDGVAINISQLKKLVCKCKSSINGSLKWMGYDIVLSKASSAREVLKLMPMLGRHEPDLRQWTIRLRSDSQITESFDDSTPAPEIMAACNTAEFGDSAQDALFELANWGLPRAKDGESGDKDFDSLDFHDFIFDS
jgi:hypothetical protein